MKPSHFIAYQERRLGRWLTLAEKSAVEGARVDCQAGKRQTVKAMWAALEAERTLNLRRLAERRDAEAARPHAGGGGKWTRSPRLLCWGAGFL